MTPRVNVEVFSPSCSSNSSFEKWSRNIEPLNTAVDGSPAQESNSTSFCISKIGVKSLPGKIVTDLDPSRWMNLANSILGESTKLIDLGIYSFNATGKPNFVFSSSTRAESLNVTQGDRFNSDWLASSHGFERVSKTKAQSNHIKKFELKIELFLSKKIFRLKIFH